MGGGFLMGVTYVTYLYKNNVKAKEKEFNQLKEDQEKSEERSKERDQRLEDRQSEIKERLVKMEATYVTRDDLDRLLDTKFERFESRIMTFFEKMTRN